MDVITVKLPVSGSKVSIRNYTTRKDDALAEAALHMGLVTVNGEVTFPLQNISTASEVYVNRLVQEVDGDSSNLQSKLEELRSEDYEAVAQAVEKIVGEHSPKVKKEDKAKAMSSIEKPSNTEKP